MTLKKLLFVSAMSGVFASAGCQAQNPEESAKQAADAARGEVQDAAATAACTTTDGGDRGAGGC